MTKKLLCCRRGRRPPGPIRLRVRQRLRLQHCARGCRYVHKIFLLSLKYFSRTHKYIFLCHKYIFLCRQVVRWRAWPAEAWLGCCCRPPAWSWPSPAWGRGGGCGPGRPSPPPPGSAPSSASGCLSRKMTNLPGRWENYHFVIFCYFEFLPRWAGLGWLAGLVTVATVSIVLSSSELSCGTGQRSWDRLYLTQGDTTPTLTLELLTKVSKTKPCTWIVDSMITWWY